MTDATQERLYTLEDLQAMPDDGNKYELHAGDLIVMSPPVINHNDLMIRLAFFILKYLETTPIAWAYTEAGYVLHRDPLTGRDTVRQPDVSVLLKGRGKRPKNRKQIQPGAPDIAVEILSPSESHATIRAKLADYFSFGVTLVWLVDPDDRLIEVYTSLAVRNILKDPDILDGGTVLPGFTLRLADLFAVLDEEDETE